MRHLTWTHPQRGVIGEALCKVDLMQATNALWLLGIQYVHIASPRSKCGRCVARREGVAPELYVRLMAAPTEATR